MHDNACDLDLSFYYARSQHCEDQLLHVCLSIRLSVRPHEQLGEF